jgi:hypothetical protein
MTKTPKQWAYWNFGAAARSARAADQANSSRARAQCLIDAITYAYGAEINANDAKLPVLSEKAGQMRSLLTQSLMGMVQ